MGKMPTCAKALQHHPGARAARGLTHTCTARFRLLVAFRLHAALRQLSCGGADLCLAPQCSACTELSSYRTQAAHLRMRLRDLVGLGTPGRTHA